MAVLLTLCKTAQRDNTLQQQHRKAVRETIPLVVFVVAHQIVNVVVLGIFAYQLYMANGNKKASIIIWKLSDFWPVVFSFLPILLVQQPRIRRSMICRRPHSQRHAITDSKQCVPTIPPSSGVSLPSDTFYSVPHESFVSKNSHSYPCTHTEHEREPLLNCSPHPMQ